MASKYDPYWATHLNEIRAAVRQAATGIPATVSVPELQHLGARRSWYGTAEVRGREVTRSAMAHAVSLGRAVAASGICAPWPEDTFRFIIDAAAILTVTSVGDDRMGSRQRASRGRKEDPSDAGSVCATDLQEPATRRAPWPAPVFTGDRQTHADELYRLLGELAGRLGERRQLRDCKGTDGWPSRGVYFFYEDGEVRADGSSRVVRVGTHALTATSRSTLWGRLRQHRGHVAGSHPGSGSHRASVFRRHVGAALIRRGDWPDTLLGSWLDQHRPPEDRAAQESEIEFGVSRYIGAMPFLWLAVPDRPDKTSDRGYLERNTIALLSSLAGGPDQPSASWLGNHATSLKVRQSGLWNVDYVDAGYDAGFLTVLAAFVERAHRPKPTSARAKAPR